MSRRPKPPASGLELSHLREALAPAFGPLCLLVLEETKPSGLTRWQATVPIAKAARNPGGRKVRMSSSIAFTV